MIQDIRRARLNGLMAFVRRRPAFALYLLALAAFPFKWLSPFAHAQAGWIDVLLALATVVWIAEWVRRPTALHFRAVHLALAAYIFWLFVSALFAPEKASTAAENVLIGLELAALMLMTSDFARTPAARRQIAMVIFVVVLVTVVETVIGVLLFYTGTGSSLVNGYSSYLRSSHLYTRVSAGFYSTSLLGSFCIFASGILAMDDSGLSLRTRRAAQVLLGVLVITTISRAAIGFAVALIVRSVGAGTSVRGTRVATVVALTGALLMVALTVMPLSLDPFRPASTTSMTNPRLKTLEASATTLWHHPVVGLGPGSLTGLQDGQPIRAHLTPLNVAATTGLPALVALTALVALLWRGRRRPTDLGVWSALLGLGLDGLGQDIEHFRHVWLMLGLADAERAGQQRAVVVDPVRRLRPQVLAASGSSSPDASRPAN